MRAGFFCPAASAARLSASLPVACLITARAWGWECRTAGNAGKRGPEWAEGRRKGGRRKKGGGEERMSRGAGKWRWRSGGAEERRGVPRGGERGRTGTRMGGGAKEKGKKKEGGKWGSEEVKERRYLFRHKRATDLAEAEESRGRGRGAERAARSGLPFRVRGGLLREGMKERALPNRSAGLVYAVADAGVRDRASCGFPSEGPAC